MDEAKYRKVADELLYLVSCAVEEKCPDRDRIEKLDMSALYKVADKHMLTALVGYALKKAGIYQQEFVQSLAKSVRKTAVMEIDKDLLFERCEEEKIWYMPLKGIVIKELYPATGLRQMSDFDILFDSSRAEDVNEIMLSLGFRCEEFGNGLHNVYYKEPVSNFEMHTALFGELHDKKMREYYKNVFERLEKDSDNNYGYHFSNSDMYIYVTAHEYRHYSSGGTGLRSLADTYMIWKKLGDTLDTEYIAKETEKLGISDFERKNRELALHLFGQKELTAEENEMLDYIIYSGVYGHVGNRVKNEVNRYGGGKKGKAKFVFKKIFMPMDRVKVAYPFFYRHKILLPCLFVYRLFRSVTVGRKKTGTLLKELKKVE